MTQADLYQELHAKNPGTAAGLGWGSERSQMKRFEAACEPLALRGLSVLDVGCGYGDIVPFLVGRQVDRYLGIDVVPEYLEFARKRWGHMGEKVDFEERDVLDYAAVTERAFDVVFAMGTVGLGDVAYLHRVMRACYRLARSVAVVSVTTVHTPGRKDGFLVLDPADLARIGAGITTRFALRHDYLPTDQMIFLYKDAA